MKTSCRNFVPLRQASLCLDCEMISDTAVACPACGSAALMNMARALGNAGQSHGAYVGPLPDHAAYASRPERRFVFERSKERSHAFRLPLLQGE
jgi:hypothetical protein